MPLLALAAAIVALTPFSVSAQHATMTTPGMAVRTLLRPYYVPGYNFATCTKLSPRLHPGLTCPETPRLLRRLRRVRRPAGAGLPFCRCQGAPRTVRIRQMVNDGRTARVDVWWDLGPGSFTDTFVVRHTTSGWLVDDEYCAGHPSTSVYGSKGFTPCA